MTEEFNRELMHLINRYGIDAMIDLPDWWLSDMVCKLLDNAKSLRDALRQEFKKEGHE